MKSRFSTYLVPQGIPFETKLQEVFFAKFVPIIPGGITRDSASQAYWQDIKWQFHTAHALD